MSPAGYPAEDFHFKGFPRLLIFSDLSGCFHAWPELLHAGPWIAFGECVYASAGSNTGIRVTVITLMSSSCPKLCAVVATSVADLAIRTNS